MAIIDPSIAARIGLLSNMFGCSILAPKPTLASEPRCYSTPLEPRTSYDTTMRKRCGPLLGRTAAVDRLTVRHFVFAGTGIPSSALHGERCGRCLVQCLIGRLAEKISASGRRDPVSRKACASLLPITAALASLHLPQTATSVVRQLSTVRAEERG